MTRGAKTATIDLDADLWRLVETQAARAGISVSQLVREAILAHILDAGTVGEQASASDARAEARALRAQSQQAVRHSRTMLQRAGAVAEANLTARYDLVFRATPDFTEISALRGHRRKVQSLPGWLEEHVHADDRGHVAAAIHECVERQAIIELEHRVLQADGTIGWTVSRAVPLVGADGQLSEWLLVSGDVRVVARMKRHGRHVRHS